jgi:Zn-dependent M28 family amino/carboxypeptidase
MQGRPASSIYEEQAARFIYLTFKKTAGIKPSYHFFSFTGTDSTHNNRSRNIYCFINHQADSTILIGAHYDHIGLGGMLSRSFLKTEVHNGADDNASGVALMLGLAVHRQAWMSHRYNYVFVAYSAHEIGLFGSRAFAKLALSRFKTIALVINFDMVGRMSNTLPRLKITGANTLPTGSEGFASSFFNMQYRLEADSLLNQADTRPFYRKGIPCLTLSTGLHDDYHAVTDDEKKINYAGIAHIQAWVERFLFTYPAAMN